MWFDAANLTWVNPSPNMRSLTEATLYTGIGLLETTNVSVGRGTDTPFELVGAPWMDGPGLAAYLNSRQIPGARFVPVRFTPKSSIFKDKECTGVNVIVTDRAKFHGLTLGIEMAVALRRLYPNDWRADDYARLLVNTDTLIRVKRGDPPRAIVKSWESKLSEFRQIRLRALLYD